MKKESGLSKWDGGSIKYWIYISLCMTIAKVAYLIAYIFLLFVNIAFITFEVIAPSTSPVTVVIKFNLTRPAWQLNRLAWWFGRVSSLNRQGIDSLKLIWTRDSIRLLSNFSIGPIYIFFFYFNVFFFFSLSNLLFFFL